MICVIFMICILLLSVTFVMYFNGRNKDIYYYYYYYYYNFIIIIIITIGAKCWLRGGVVGQFPRNLS